jgi:hypothetical protein
VPEFETLCKMKHSCCLYLIALEWIRIPSGVTKCTLVSEFYSHTLAGVLNLPARDQIRNDFTATTKACVAFGIAKGWTREISREATPELAKLICKCCNIAPEGWPTFDDIVNHPRVFLSPGQTRTRTATSRTLSCSSPGSE